MLRQNVFLYAPLGICAQVLIWFYGGAFVNGGESFYDGSVLASLHNVVVVIPNYRVSVFGFLSLGNNTNYPGNMGLLDQIMAMRYVCYRLQRVCIVMGLECQLLHNL